MGDAALIQIVDAAMAEAVARGGAWIACRPGCAECCIGPFAITPLDAARLRRGLRALDAADPARARRVRDRAREAVRRIEHDYPGDSLARVLAEDDAAESNPCPALDPETRTCDLYAFRPVTCRTFGPAVSFGGEALAVCELCYQGASDEEIAASRVEVDAENLEGRLVAQAGGADTIVAYALVEAPGAPTGNTPADSPAST